MTPPGSVVALHGANSPLAFATEQVYFAFASGRFDYDCVSCQARCCRGFGYSLQGDSELAGQVRSRPEVRFFLRRADAVRDSGFTVVNCRPACFFLNADGRCDVHAEHGAAAKPETCRLFPFNGFRRVGSTLVVTPHTTLCPLRVVGSSSRSERSHHEPLLAAMSARGIGARVAAVSSIGGDAARLVALERCIVTLSEAHLDATSYVDFAIAQMVASTEAAPAANIALEAMRRFVDTCCAVLDVPSSIVTAPGRDVVRVMAAATPSLRTQLIFPMAKPALGQTLALDRVPRVLLMLAALVELARRAGMHEVTYQTVMHVFADNMTLLTMLAQVDQAVAWRPTELIEMSVTGSLEDQTRYAAILRALLPRYQQRHPRTLGAVICEHIGVEAVGRAVFLRALADRVSGRVMAIADLESRSLGRRGLRPAIQQWALGHVSDPAIVQLASRRGAHAHSQESL